jgi:acyl-CoA thioester hydrolase
MSLQGEIVGGVHRLSVRVYYEDTDFSGYVYHANYLKFCERARSDWIRLAGIDQNALAETESKIYFMIRRMNCEFLRPAKFDDVLTVETKPGDVGGARFGILQRVLRGEEELFTADVLAVLVDDRGRPKRVPVEWMAKFSGSSA